MAEPPVQEETQTIPDAAIEPETQDEGVVLGSQDATPLEFWIGVEPGRLVQLDDLIVCETATPKGESVRFYGVVDIVRKKYEGASFDTDAFRVNAGTFPADVSYAAHVQVTRIEPEVFMPPHPGNFARVVRGEDFQKALYFDKMVSRVPVGLTRAGEPAFANLEFMDGRRGAHVSISGVSGVATKTSYATFLVYAMFHSGVLGADAINTKTLVFNVKGEDLLWLDKPNARLDEVARGQYAKLGLPAGPFGSVGIFAPAKRQVSTPIPDTGQRQEGVKPYFWTMREFARERLLRFCFVDAEDARAQISYVITRVEQQLERAAQEGNPDDPAITVAEQRVVTFYDLVGLLDQEGILDVWVHAASGTLDAFRRRVHAAADRMGHLVRASAEIGKYKINWEASQVSVIDIHNLHSIAQMFVVGAVLKRLMEQKESTGTAKPQVFVLLDELNKYAPRDGWSPIRDVILDIAERGRSLGVCLLGAQQTASEVERRVLANASIKIVGRLDSAESERSEYGFLTKVARLRATMLRPGTMIVAQPDIPTALLLQFPFPAWATKADEVTAGAKADPFVRIHD